jgi:MFS family permease
MLQRTGGSGARESDPQEVSIGPPRIYYGWYVLGGLSVTQIVSWGILYYAFGTLMPSMHADLGWTTSEMTGAFSAGLLASALAAVPLGHYIDRHGARGVMTVGSCAASLLVAAWAQVETLPAFYAIWIGLGIAMAAVLYESAFAVLVRWFVRGRARALSILTSVGGFASTVFVPVVAWLALRYSWRDALLILAAGLAFITIPIHAFVLRGRPADVGLLPDGDGWVDTTASGKGSTVRVAATSIPGRAWWVALIFGANTLTAAAAAVHLFPYLLLRGHGPEAAALVLAAVGAAQVPGRIFFTPLTRRVSKDRMASLVFLLPAAGLVCLSLAPTSPWLLGVFAALFGAGHGLITLVRATLVADWFDEASYATIGGTLAVCIQLARAAGPIAVAVLAARVGYEPVWWLLSIVAGLTALAMFAMASSMRRPAYSSRRMP